jgi:hypothetical protein
VGAGTFQPVKTENLAEHQMHSEWYEIPLATLAALERCRQRGGRVVAVGTTTVRTLESWAQSGQARATPHLHHAGLCIPGGGPAAHQLPPAQEHADDAGQRLRRLRAHHGLYRHAIAQRYRFFSYGDAMLLRRRGQPPERLRRFPLLEWRRHSEEDDANAAGRPLRGVCWPGVCQFHAPRPFFTPKAVARYASGASAGC